MPSTSHNEFTTVEATVTSKGAGHTAQELRKRLGLGKGSRIRFSISESGPVQVASVRYKIDDLWRMSDARGRPGQFMSFEEMNETKARRNW